MAPRLKTLYLQEAVPALMASGRYTNRLQAPRLVKIVVNMGINSQAEREAVKNAADDLARVSGQRPVVIKARKSISNFKLRQGMPIGVKVTLRGDRMYEFLERLISAALPRIRDFRGVSPKSFDGRGNYTLGLKEQALFPEIRPDQVKKPQGMDITLASTARTDAEMRELLRLLGLPFAAA